MTAHLAVILVAVLRVSAAVQPAPSASDAWAAPTSAGTASVYLVITNPTMYDIYVTSATSEVAGKVVLMSGDQPVEHLTVPSYGSLELKAGGMSLRLSELKRALKTGEAIAVSVETDGGLTIAATAAVK